MALRNDPAVEQDCLARLIAGEDVWPHFWDLFGPVIESEVHRFFGKSEDRLDDTYQDLVVKLLAGDRRILRRHQARRPPGPFGALVRVTVRNMLIDGFRARKRRGELVVDDPDGYFSNLGGDGSGPERRVLDQRRLLDLLYSVTGRRWESSAFRILVLRFVVGESVKYIADQMKMREGTVRHAILYYLKKLGREHRQALLEMCDD